MSDNEGLTPTPPPDEPSSDSPEAESGSAPDKAEPAAPEQASEPTPAPEPTAAPPPPTEWIPPPAAVAPATNIPLGGSGYPVSMTIAPDEGQNRLWGIPFVGLTIRAILVIPQAIVLWVLALAIAFVTLFSWLPILINGRQAEFVYAIIGGYLRLATRVGGYVLLMTGRYPPFGPGGEHTIDLTFDENDEQNRLWGIPFVGLMVRWILPDPALHRAVLHRDRCRLRQLDHMDPGPRQRTDRRLGRSVGGRLLPLVQPRVCVHAAAERQVPAVPAGRLSRWPVRLRGPPTPSSKVGSRRGG